MVTADPPINEGALHILRRIEQGTMKLRGWLYLPTRQRGAKLDLAEAWEVAHEYRTRGELDDEAWEKIIDRVETWVSDVEAEWEDRARRIELVAPCPQCGERWILDPAKVRGEEPKRRSAVVIEYAADRVPVAECRVAGCEAMWVGWKQLAQLGFALNVEQDLAVLEACGISLSFDTP